MGVSEGGRMGQNVEGDIPVHSQVSPSKAVLHTRCV